MFAVTQMLIYISLIHFGLSDGRYPSLRRQLNVYGFKKYKRSHRYDLCVFVLELDIPSDDRPSYTIVLCFRYKGAFHHPSIHRNMTNWQSLMLKPIVRPSRASKSKNAPFLRHGKPVDEKPSPASPPNRMGEKAAISSLTGKCALEKLNIPSSDGSYAGLPVVSGRTDRAALTSASSGTEAALEEYGMYDKYHNLISGSNEGADVGETEETSFSMEYTTPSEIKPQIGLFDPISYLEGGGFSEKRDLRTLADAAELAAAKGWNTNLTKYSPVIRADFKENDTPIHAIYTRDLGSLWDKSPAAVRMQFDSTTPLVSASPIDPGVRKNIGKYPHPGMPDYSPSFITSVLERSGATLWTPNFDDKEIDIPSPPMEQWFSPPKFPSLPMHKSFSPGKNLDLDTLETYVTRIDIESKKRKRSTVHCSPPYLSPDSPTMTFEDFCSVSSEISFSTERLSGEAEICTASS
jgi:hypothetical protein